MELHPVTIILGALGVIVLAALVATGIWCMDPAPELLELFHWLRARQIC